MRSTTRTAHTAAIAGLTMVTALLTGLLAVLSTAAPASANAPTGTPGGFYLNRDADGLKTMTQAALTSPLTIGPLEPFVWRSVETAGVSVDRSAASANAQRITAVYSLEARTPGASSWTLLGQDVNTTTVPGAQPQDFYHPIPDLGGHRFGVPSAVPFGTTFRVRYDITWRDTVTDRLLGSWSLSPTRANNRCPLPGLANPQPCSVTSEGVLW